MFESGSEKKTASVKLLKQTSKSRVGRQRGSRRDVDGYDSSERRVRRDRRCSWVWPILGLASSGSTASIVSAITTSQTAFQTQSTAFVGSPGDPRPNQEGGGVWGRAIGGQIDTKNTVPWTTLISNRLSGRRHNCCDRQQRLQHGNSARFCRLSSWRRYRTLNVNGWNLHYGGTAGYMAPKPKTPAADCCLPFLATTIVPTFQNNSGDSLRRHLWRRDARRARSSMGKSALTIIRMN